MALIDDLGGRVPRGYLHQAYPSPVDAVVARTVEQYAAGPDRDSRRDAVDADSASVLNVYVERQAVRAVRSASPAPLRSGLWALDLATGASDYRNTLRLLAVLDHAAGAVGGSLAQLSSALPLSASTAGRLGTFLARPAPERSLSALGYATEGSGARFHYVSTIGDGLTEADMQAIIASRPGPARP